MKKPRPVSVCDMCGAIGFDLEQIGKPCNHDIATAARIVFWYCPECEGEYYHKQGCTFIEGVDAALASIAIKS